MKFITPYIHVFFDYISVIAFILVPIMLGWSGAVATTAFIFAGIHLIITCSTNLPLTPFKWIPLNIHAQYEFIISGLLIILTWPLGLETHPIKLYFYCNAGIIFFIVWMFTNYTNSEAKKA